MTAIIPASVKYSNGPLCFFAEGTTDARESMTLGGVFEFASCSIDRFANGSASWRNAWIQ